MNQAHRADIVTAVPGRDAAGLSTDQLTTVARACLRLFELKREPATLSSWQERTAKKLMLDNLDRSIQIAAIARECALSRSHFSRAFKNTTGQAPRDWLKRARLSRARELLEQTDVAISQVGFECGFSDQPHFTRMFSQQFGMTPGKARALSKQPA